MSGSVSNIQQSQGNLFWVMIYNQTGQMSWALLPFSEQVGSSSMNYHERAQTFIILNVVSGVAEFIRPTGPT